MAESRRVYFQSNQTLISQPPENTYSITSADGPSNIINSDEVMYPIKNLFEEVVKQEDIMWNKTQGVNIPVGGVSHVLRELYFYNSVYMYMYVRMCACVILACCYCVHFEAWWNLQ